MGRRVVDFLLAEDNEDDVVLIEESLADARVKNPLRVVSNGEEALRYLRKEGEHQGAPTPGLVLLDINMPLMNGFEVLEAIKGDSALRHLPVVMLTTSGRDEDVLHSYQSGASTYIRKPVDFDRFREVIKHFALYWTLVAEAPPVDG